MLERYAVEDAARPASKVMSVEVEFDVTPKFVPEINGNAKFA